MNEFDIDGIYTDSIAVIHQCSNVNHGCGYIRADGSLAPTYPVFAGRDLLSRLYTIIMSRKSEGQLNMHQSGSLTAAMAYATSNWDGEHIHNPHKKHPLDILPLDMFHAEFMGHPLGVSAENLDTGLGADMLAVTLLHDVLVGRPQPSIIASNPQFPIVMLWRLSDEFGRKEAQWLPYWKNWEYVEVTPDGAYVSLYRHPKNGVLAVVSNLGTDKAVVKVALNLARLGFRPPLTAYNALTKETVSVSNESLTLTLPPMGWQIVWLKRAERR